LIYAVNHPAVNITTRAAKYGMRVDFRTMSSRVNEFLNIILYIGRYAKTKY
jgi:hypothetical protein